MSAKSESYDARQRRYPTIDYDLTLKALRDMVIEYDVGSPAWGTEPDKIAIYLRSIIATAQGLIGYYQRGLSHRAFMPKVNKASATKIAECEKILERFERIASERGLK